MQPRDPDNPELTELLHELSCAKGAFVRTLRDEHGATWRDALWVEWSPSQGPQPRRWLSTSRMRALEDLPAYLEGTDAHLYPLTVYQQHLIIGVAKGAAAQQGERPGCAWSFDWFEPWRGGWRGGKAPR